jgi:hypothetical protein
MLEFLKRLGGGGTPSQPESQRARFERLVADLNEALDDLSDKPAVTVQPDSGHISFEMPEQFPDEALALPKPDESVDHSSDEEVEKDTKAA